ncbi:hypothetical protein Pelo_3796 [Pelomyxa schiedti]|nr:hypothetical protein Pelo_3796 [Pelomyxa schiedti]
MHREISVARCALVALGAALVASAVLRLPLFSAANPNDRLYAWNVTYDPPKTDETVALGTLHGGAFSPLADCFPRKYVSGHASCFGGWNPTTALHSLSDFDAADLHFWLTSVNVSRLACTGNLNCSVDLNMYIADNGASLVATAISFVKPASLAGCFVFDTLTAKYSLVVLLRPSTAADSTCMNEGAQTFDSRLFVGMASGDDYAFLWAVDAVESRLYKVWPATGKLEGIGCSLGISVPHPSVVRDQALFYNLTSRELFYSIATNGTTTVWEIDVQTGEVIDNMWNISNANLQGMAMTTFDPPVSHDAGDPMCPGDAGNEAYVPAGVAALFALSGIGETIFRLDVLPPTGFQQNQSSLCSNTMISTLVGDTETGNDQLFFSVVSSGLLWTVDTSTCSISYMSLSGTCPTFLEVVLCSTWSISLGKLLVITYQTMFGNSLYAIDVHELKCTYLGMIVDSLARDIYVMGIAEIDKVLFILDPSFGGGDAELFVLDPCLCMAYSNASLGTSFDVDSPISMDYDNRTHYLFIHASNTSKLKAGYHGEIFSYSVATESLRPVLQLSNDTYCISTISCPVYDLPSLSSSHSFSDQSSSTSLSLSSSTSGSFSSSLSTSISESISKSVSQSSSVSTSTSASESSSESISTSESTSKSTSNSHSVSVLESSSQQSSSSSLSTPPLSVFVSSQSSQESLPSFSAVLLSSEDKKDEKSLALIIGLTVSLGGAFFIGMAVFAFLFVLRKKRQHVSRDYDLDTLHGSSSNSASHISAGSAAKEAVRLSRLCRHDSTIDLDGFRQVHAEEFPLQVEPEATLDFGLGGHQESHNTVAPSFDFF